MASLGDQPQFQAFVESPAARQQLYRRTLAIVILAQVFGGAGLAAGITVGALIAQDLLGVESYAGLPVALATLGSAAAALFVGRLSNSYGRRLGLAAGFLAGGLGAAGVVVAAVYEQVPLLFAALLIYGAGTATNLQARYAGTDLAAPTQRAKAVSTAMVFTTLGAVAGPNLATTMGRVAEGWGMPVLTGPFILAAAAFLLAGAVFLVLLRPDPLLVARAVAAGDEPSLDGAQTDLADPGNGDAGPVDADHTGTTGGAALPSHKHGHEHQTNMGRPGLITGATTMVLAQMAMVAIMTMTPIHLMHHGHGLGTVGLTISIHVAAMYLPSPLTGFLTDRFGRRTMAYAAAVTLLAAGLLSALAPGDNPGMLMVALALLGLGWNFGIISGTATVVDATTPDTRAKTQGAIDVLISLAGASGGALSGMVVARAGYAVLSFAGGFLALLLIPVFLWSARRA